MAKLILNIQDYNGIGRILNLINATQDQEPVTFAQLKAAIEGLASKVAVKVASVSNINLAAPGATINGITMAVNDRFLPKDQTAPAENGIYIWNGAAVPATRSLDASTSVELHNAIVSVNEGTHAGQTWRQTSVNFTLDSGAVNWIQFGTGASAASETSAGIAEIATQAESDTGTDDARILTPLKAKNASWMLKGATLVIGDGAATQFDLTHSWGTRNVHVSVVQNATPWGDVDCDIERPDTNTVRVRFAGPPANNAYIILATKAI